MSWRPALIGAVVVIAAGFGVGLAVGGREPSRIRTVTVTAAQGTTKSVSSTTNSRTDGTKQVQFLVDTPEPKATNIYPVQTQSHVRVGHETFGQAVTFNSIFLEDCGSNATVEYPVQTDTATFVAALGWTQDSDSGASAVLELHANTARGPLLFRHAFTGPAEPLKVHVPLHGAVKAIFVFVPTGDMCNPNYDLTNATFAFGDPRFVG